MAKRFPPDNIQALKSQLFMVSFQFRRAHPDPALARYPAAMAGLLSLGKAREETNYRPQAVHVGFGNLCRFLGRYGQSESEYAQALHLDQNAVEAWIGLAHLAEARRDIPEAVRCWGKVQEASRKSGLSPADQILVAESAEEALAALRKGVIPPSEPPLTTPSAAPKPSSDEMSGTAKRKAAAMSRVPAAAARGTSTAMAARDSGCICQN